jgi:release factor glutamine methyltransferase
MSPLPYLANRTVPRIIGHMDQAFMNAADSKEAAWLLKEKYQGIETEAYFEDLASLRAGVPLDYVIGWVPFLETKILLDSKPLIPRPETEYWVERAIDLIKQEGPKDGRMLDLCAGSGAIGIALLRHLPDSLVDFAELERAHHMTILKNLVENRIDQARARIFGGDLFERVMGPYDHILTNPPYIDPSLKDRVQASVVAHEPSAALWGGHDGFEYIGRIIRDAHIHLTPGGFLFIEHEPEQVERIHESARLHGYGAFETHADQYGVPRMTVLRKA